MTLEDLERAKDINKDAAEKIRAQVRQIPDSPQDLSVIQARWQHIVEHQPHLRREIARISLEVAPIDEHLRGRICSALIELVLILEDQPPDEDNYDMSSRTEEDILQHVDEKASDVYDAVSAQPPLV